MSALTQIAGFSERHRAVAEGLMSRKPYQLTAFLFIAAMAMPSDAHAYRYGPGDLGWLRPGTVGTESDIFHNGQSNIGIIIDKRTKISLNMSMSGEVRDLFSSVSAYTLLELWGGQYLNTNYVDTTGLSTSGLRYVDLTDDPTPSIFLGPSKALFSQIFQENINSLSIIVSNMSNKPVMIDLFIRGNSIDTSNFTSILNYETVYVTPIPSALPLFASGLLGLGVIGRRRSAA